MPVMEDFTTDDIEDGDRLEFDYKRGADGIWRRTASRLIKGESGGATPQTPPPPRDSGDRTPPQGR